jgi:uncharacterized membrane protein YwzB
MDHDVIAKFTKPTTSTKNRVLMFFVSIVIFVIIVHPVVIC